MKASYATRFSESTITVDRDGTTRYHNVEVTNEAELVIIDPRVDKTLARIKAGQVEFDSGFGPTELTMEQFMRNHLAEVRKVHADIVDVFTLTHGLSESSLLDRLVGILMRVARSESAACKLLERMVGNYVKLMDTVFVGLATHHALKKTSYLENFTQNMLDGLRDIEAYEKRFKLKRSDVQPRAAMIEDPKLRAEFYENEMKDWAEPDELITAKKNMSATCDGCKRDEANPWSFGLSVDQVRMHCSHTQFELIDETWNAFAKFYKGDFSDVETLLKIAFIIAGGAVDATPTAISFHPLPPPSMLVLLDTPQMYWTTVTMNGCELALPTATVAARWPGVDIKANICEFYIDPKNPTLEMSATPEMPEMPEMPEICD